MSSKIQLIKPQDSNEDVILGIDFGTTNSLVAAIINNSPQVVCDQGNFLTPSLVSYYNNEAIVGEKALLYPPVIRSVKRKIANSPSSLDISVASLIFKELVDKAVKFFATLNIQLTKVKAVVTVPAYFHGVARGKIKEAAELAGIEVIRLISEPTAAALSYNQEQFIGKPIAVYDLGGGTFDLSVLIPHQERMFQVLAVGGDRNLGGDDFDQAIFDYLTPNHPLSLEEAKKIKDGLLASTLKSSELEEIFSPLAEKTIKITKSTIKEAEEKSGQQVRDILLVGGASRIPLLAQLLEEKLKLKVHKVLDPEKAVVIGAAWQGHFLSQSHNKLIDVLPLSLGIESYGGIMETIIERNSPLPCSHSVTFTTAQSQQQFIQINVFQGERPLVADNQLITSFKVAIPLSPAGAIRLKVDFQADVDGILGITTTEETTNERYYTSIDAYSSKTEVENKMQEAAEYFDQDLAKLHFTQLTQKARELQNTTKLYLGYNLKQEHLLLLNRQIDQFIQGKQVLELENALVSLENTLNMVVEELAKQNKTLTDLHS